MYILAARQAKENQLRELCCREILSSEHTYVANIGKLITVIHILLFALHTRSLTRENLL